MNNELILPKQTANLDVFDATLKIYSEADGAWVANRDYKTRIQELVPRLTTGARDEAFMVKQSEMARYFGFVEYDFKQRRARITPAGKKIYEARVNHDQATVHKLILQAILNNSFGRNNSAIQSSDSDVDPPKLFIKAILDTTHVNNDTEGDVTGGISRTDLAYLIYLTHDKGIAYEDAINLLLGYYTLPADLPNKYTDVKFPKFLENLGIVLTQNGNYLLSPEIMLQYAEQIKNLTIYNTNHASEIVNEDLEYEAIMQAAEYPDLESNDFIRQNEREPVKVVNTQTTYKRDAGLAKTVLVRSDYKCLLNETHTTFTSKDGHPYIEAHHLIPMSAQKDFDTNIDRVENIVALCPNCHKAIHYGDDATRRDLVERLYNLKQADFAQAELDISADELYSRYYA